jgi:hypothetical protein
MAAPTKTKAQVKAPAPIARKPATQPQAVEQQRAPELQRAVAPAAPQTAGSSPPPSDALAPARAAAVLGAPDQRPGAASRARMSGALQRSVGNARMGRIAGAPVQTKLTVGAPNDVYEQEAEHVADRVMRMSHPGSDDSASVSGHARSQQVQRCPACERAMRPAAGQELCPACRDKLRTGQNQAQRQVAEGQEEASKVEEPVMAKLSSTDQQAVNQEMEPQLIPSEGGGSSLPHSARAFMEPRFGREFGDVRIHNDAAAARSASSIGAAAYTSGNHIHFGAGKYEPDTAEGKKLLAHELTHVVQQSKGRMKKSLNASDTQQQGEKETNQGAHEVSRKAEKSRQASIASSISPYNRSTAQLAPNVTAVNGPAEVAAGRRGRARFQATAPRGTTITWSIQGANPTGAVLGTSTTRTNTLTIPAASTGGTITIRAADAGNATDFADTNITLVEVQQPTFAFAPAMPGFAPANTMDASVCNNTATATAVTVPATRPVTWSIVGNRRGATIDPATGVINPSATQTGSIQIRATDNAVPQARNQQTLTIQAHPTGIRRTQIVAGGFPIPAAQGGPYGAIYTHTFRSSGGGIANVMITEQVFSGNDPFGLGGLPVLPGNLNAPAGTLQDIIGTPQAGINVNNFLPSPPNAGLPQVMNTPQILYWRSDQCSAAPAAPPAAAPGDHWVPFVNVNITATLFRRGANFFFQTVDNGVRTPREPYTGPALAVGGAPAASACPPGTSVSRIRFSPDTLAADSSALTTTAATAQVRPGGSAITWSFPGQNFGAAIAAQGNPALISAGNTAGRIRVRAALTATPGCFAEGSLQMQEVQTGPIRFNPATVRATQTTRATVTTHPGSRVVTWTIQGPALGAVIATNPDNSATITAGAQRGRITIRATDQRDVTKFTETSLVIS